MIQQGMIGVKVTHTCPVCGEIAPCIFTAQNATEPLRVHNCHMCGSTWKEQLFPTTEVKAPAPKTGPLSIPVAT